MRDMHSQSSVWQKFCNDFSGKKVFLFGLGRQGGGAKVANTFVAAGARVTIFDALSEAELQDSLAELDPSIDLKLGIADPDLTAAEYIIKNPAVPFNHFSVIAAQNAGIPVVGETALAVAYLRDRCIGITGTRGKTTTTTLTGKLLEAAGWKVVVGGNIPQFPALSLLQECDDDTWAVLEISSFQLESFAHVQASPHIAVVTNVYPDHLNRYASLEEYAQTKAEIFRFQQAGDTALFAGPVEWHETFQKNIVSEVESHNVTASEVEQVKNRYRTQLPGDHNWENIAMVEAIRESLQIPESALQSALDTFTGVPYRLETIRELNGVQFVNDTTSTTPVALEKALEAFTPGSFVLITGGATKHLPLERALLERLAQNPAAVFSLPGTGSSELLDAVTSAGLSLPNLQQMPDLASAVQQAFAWAQENQVPTVLFSPGFTSFEMFKNEFDRGDHYNRFVRDL